MGQTLPDGEYEGVIVDAVVGESKSESKRLQCVWTLRATEDGDYKDREVLKFSGLETGDNMAWFKGDLEALELDIPDNIDNIGDTLNDAINLPILFSVRTRDEFTNIDFIEVLEGGSEARGNGKGSADGDTLTADEVAEMDEKELAALIKAEDLDIDSDKYETWEEVADLVVEQMGLE